MFVWMRCCRQNNWIDFQQIHIKLDHYRCTRTPAYNVQVGSKRPRLVAAVFTGGRPRQPGGPSESHNWRTGQSTPPLFFPILTPMSTGIYKILHGCCSVTAGFQVYVTANPGVETRPPPFWKPPLLANGTILFLSLPLLFFYNPDSYESWDDRKPAGILRCLLARTGLMPSSTWGVETSSPFWKPHLLVHGQIVAPPPPPASLIYIPGSYLSARMEVNYSCAITNPLT